MSALMMGIVATIFLSVLSSVQTSLGREQTRSIDNDQARLAVEAIDREVRSGNVLYDPGAETCAAGVTPCVTGTHDGYQLRVYTQANAPTRNSGNPMCVQWRLTNGRLLSRSWPSGNTAGATGWRAVAENLVNASQAVAPFQLDSSTATGGRLVNITLLVNAKTTDTSTRTMRVETSVAIRNQTTGDPCTPVPSG